MDERRKSPRTRILPRTLSIQVTEELAARMVAHCREASVQMDDAVSVALELMLRDADPTRSVSP